MSRRIFFYNCCIWSRYFSSILKTESSVFVLRDVQLSLDKDLLNAPSNTINVYVHTRIFNVYAASHLSAQNLIYLSDCCLVSGWHFMFVGDFHHISFPYLTLTMYPQQILIRTLPLVSRVINIGNVYTLCLIYILGPLHSWSFLDKNLPLKNNEFSFPCTFNPQKTFDCPPWFSFLDEFYWENAS